MHITLAERQKTSLSIWAKRRIVLITWLKKKKGLHGLDNSTLLGVRSKWSEMVARGQFGHRILMRRPNSHTFPHQQWHHSGRCLTPPSGHFPLIISKQPAPPPSATHKTTWCVSYILWIVDVYQWLVVLFLSSFFHVPLMIVLSHIIQQENSFSLTQNEGKFSK